MSLTIEERTVAPSDTTRADAAAPQHGAHDMPHMPKEFLSFRLGGEEYGIDILRVQEIRSYEAPTRIANAPHFIKGVLNLRGVIVPVADLRLKFGCETAAYTSATVIIVLNVKGRVVGAVVDSVSDVLALDVANIKPAPQMGAAVDATYIMGIGCTKMGDQERMLILTDIEALMSGADMQLTGSGMT